MAETDDRGMLGCAQREGGLLEYSLHIKSIQSMYMHWVSAAGHGTDAGVCLRMLGWHLDRATELAMTSCVGSKLYTLTCNNPSCFCKDD